MPKAYCPSCDGVVSLTNPREQMMINCDECGAELEVISVDPFEVDFPLDYDEEWDDEDEEDY